jgi:hypothetical protein
MTRLKGAFLPAYQLPGHPGGKVFLSVFLFKSGAGGRRGRASLWKPVPRQATHGRLERKLGKKVATSSPLPRQGIQRILPRAGGPGAVPSSTSSSRETNSCGCVRGPIPQPPRFRVSLTTGIVSTLERKPELALGLRARRAESYGPDRRLADGPSTWARAGRRAATRRTGIRDRVDGGPPTFRSPGQGGIPYICRRDRLDLRCNTLSIAGAQSPQRPGKSAKKTTSDRARFVLSGPSHTIRSAAQGDVEAQLRVLQEATRARC